MSKLIVSSVAALWLCTTPAYAYLDPGTGSMLLQAAIAGVASSLFVIKMYWHKLKAMLGLVPANAQADDADVK